MIGGFNLDWVNWVKFGKQSLKSTIQKYLLNLEALHYHEAKNRGRIMHCQLQSLDSEDKANSRCNFNFKCQIESKTFFKEMGIKQISSPKLINPQSVPANIQSYHP